MKAEIYKAMRARISKASAEQSKEYNEYFHYNNETKVWRFNADGLGEDIDSIMQGFHTNNIWNVAQAFYSRLSWLCEDFDQKLLNS